MADRLYMKDNPPRLITSKPGYNASPTLDYIYKTFDSDWFNGAGIRWIFNVVIPYTGNARTSKTFYFPYALDHVPKYTWFWGGWSATSPGIWSTQGVNWPFLPNQSQPSFSYAWQITPGNGNSQTPNNRFTVYNDRCEIIDTIVPATPTRGTLIVYQS